MRKLAGVLSLLIVFALVISACGSSPAATATPTAMPTTAPEPTQAVEATMAPTDTPVAAPAGGEINAAGSTTVQPLAEKLAEAFMAQNPDMRIAVQGGGSSTGVKSAGQGTVDLGMASREIKESELAEFPNLKIFVIARDGIAVIAHPDVPVESLSLEQVRDIFAGNVMNWSEVGGPDAEIAVVAREEGSGTRAAFEEMVMGEEALITANAILQPSNGAVRSTVASTPNSVGFLSFGYIDDSIKTIAVDGVAPTAENTANGTYPVVRPLNMLTNGEPSELVQSFLNFILSPEGQAIVEAEGYLTVN